MDRIRALLFDHRRPIAAAFAALAVLTGLQSLQPDDPGTPILVASRDLDSGHVITASDLTSVSMPQTAQPSHLLDRDAAVGRRVAAPVRAGEPITDRRVIDPRDLSGHGPDAALTMIRLDDSAALTGLRVGDQIDVVATVIDSTTTTEVVAKDATVAVVPSVDDDADSTVIGIITDRASALDVAASALEARLSVLIRS